MGENPYKSPREDSESKEVVSDNNTRPNIARMVLTIALFSCVAGATIGFIAWITLVAADPMLRESAFRDGAWLGLFFFDGRPTIMLAGALSAAVLILMRVHRR